MLKLVFNSPSQVEAFEQAVFVYNGIVNGDLSVLSKMFQSRIIPLKAESVSIDQFNDSEQRFNSILSEIIKYKVECSQSNSHLLIDEALVASVNEQLLHRDSAEISVPIDMAYRISAAFDFFTRLCLGQLHELAYFIRSGQIPSFEFDRDYAKMERASDLVEGLRETLGFLHGESFGIGNKRVYPLGHHAWEIKKVMDKALAYYRDPNPSFKGVNYDGLILKYTQDPDPVAVIV